MEKITMDHELLEPVKAQLEGLLTGAMNLAATQGKETDITLKLSVSVREGFENETEEAFKYPYVDYVFNEKVKEAKATSKSWVGGQDFRIEEDDITGDITVKKLPPKEDI